MNPWPSCPLGPSPTEFAAAFTQRTLVRRNLVEQAHHYNSFRLTLKHVPCWHRCQSNTWLHQSVQLWRPNEGRHRLGGHCPQPICIHHGHHKLGPRTVLGDGLLYQTDFLQQLRIIPLLEYLPRKQAFRTSMYHHSILTDLIFLPRLVPKN